MPRHDREQLRLSMTAAEWAKYESDERAMLESIPRADDAAPAAPAAPTPPTPAPSLADVLADAGATLIAASLAFSLSGKDAASADCKRAAQALHDALVAEEARDQLRRRAAEIVLAHHRANLSTLHVDMVAWAKMETSR